MKQAPHTAPTANASVLVVDDDPNGLRLMRGLLAQAGYRAEVAFGADDALRKLSRRHFDLALVELAMKQVSGIRLIEIIKANPLLAETPVLAITTPIRRSLAHQLGCDGFVFRPIEAAQFLQSVRNACAPQHLDLEANAASGAPPPDVHEPGTLVCTQTTSTTVTTVPQRKERQ